MMKVRSGAILEVEGILGEILPQVLRDRLPGILERHRNERIFLIITTLTGDRMNEAIRRGCFFRPARKGQLADFTWKMSGPLNGVLRQFRLDFLRHLGREEMNCPICLAIYREGAAGEDPPAESVAEARASLQLLEAAAAEEQRTARPAPAPDHDDHRAAPPRIPAGAVHPRKAESAPAAESVNGRTPAPEPAAPPQSETAAAPPPERTGSPDAPHHGPIPGRGTRALIGNLYQDFFGFESMPFNNTPDTHFYFPSEKHQEALSRLIYAISERKGFVMISGEIGAGKSTLCRTLLSQLPNDVKTALITHTHLDATQLIRAIADDLGLETVGMNRFELLQSISQYLIEQLAAGCTVCIIIDEAQNLSPEALEEVRMISNLETETEKLVQLILLGQPDLREKIRLPELYQLRQRISVQYHLEPLEAGETIGYIEHRLKVARPAQELSFTRRAMIEVHRFSGGVPRLINTLCDSALLTAFIRQQRRVTPLMIREAARELALDPRTRAGLAAVLKFW